LQKGVVTVLHIAISRLRNIEPQRVSLMLVLAAGLFWSLQAFMVRLIDTASPEQIVFWRSAGQFVSMITVASRGRTLNAFRYGGRLAFLGGICAAGASLSFVFALSYLSVANVVFMLAAAPVFAAAGGWILLRETLTRSTLIAMTLVLLGIGIMSSTSLGTGRAIGFAFALSTTLCFAGLAVVSRVGGGTSMLPAGVWAGIINLLAMPLLFSDVLSVSAHDATLAIISGGVLTAGGATCFMIGARHVPAGVLPMLSLTEIILAPIWVWLGFGEVPTSLTMIGGAIVLSAIAFEAYNRFKRTELKS
jgi:DME family drug/metabolite transporter